ncbi:sodium/proton antiporter NhaB [Hydrocarboniclastica marina]|uniref:Na(+)/H(+) antiporter NhaB n=1 Tax=Hydrocarboniclastica marina TaxID=2259620 RepID=A0A4P7XIN5_9ALTE|nr:sodium/proton antiporter NhaB [Hydrocarboniclastica marina]MAL96883.1 sodium/proton antiporter NhaB [Alteromonadaceae bacterium]QCF26182.1 sodium/proton antiporter NhaB [Hydrocarboniclastica marina]
MITTYPQAIFANFLGKAPAWYKQVIVLFLFINPIVFALEPFLAGWLLIVEFIFTLAMALKCYPLQPGGLLAIEAVLIGMVAPATVFMEVQKNIEVILLLVFMVAGIYFMKDLLLFAFTKILVGIRSKSALALFFSLTAAFLSAFLDALTVTAVVISVTVGFFAVYHKVASEQTGQANYDYGTDKGVTELHRADLESFRAFLRSLLMHAAVGTALGGVATQVGEPQNLIIAKRLGWDFVEFFKHMAIVSLPTLLVGLTTCVLLEKTRVFGYGERLPRAVRKILEDFARTEQNKMTLQHRSNLAVQAVVAVLLILGLAFHVAEVGLIGLMVIVLVTSFTGIVDEHQIGKAFQESLPFTALLVVFFTVVGVIHELHLFQGIIDLVLSLPVDRQPGMLFLANGVLSAISDNVFVATVYIDEVTKVFEAGLISREHFEKLAVAINTGTNLPSVATPNGQAAFLFLLTSTIAPLVRLSYGKMVVMALPYAIVMGATGFIMVEFFL